MMARISEIRKSSGSGANKLDMLPLSLRCVGLKFCKTFGAWEEVFEFLAVRLPGISVRLHISFVRIKIFSPLMF